LQIGPEIDELPSFLQFFSQFSPIHATDVRGTHMDLFSLLFMVGLYLWMPLVALRSDNPCFVTAQLGAMAWCVACCFVLPLLSFGSAWPWLRRAMKLGAIILAVIVWVRLGLATDRSYMPSPSLFVSLPVALSAWLWIVPLIQKFRSKKGSLLQLCGVIALGLGGYLLPHTLFFEAESSFFSF
jgi:hypothetical protein